jgi:hypothetical protein
MVMIDFHIFRFDLAVGASERRIFLAEVADWLRDVVGLGFFTIVDSDDEITEVTQWVVVMNSSHIKVLLRDGKDATAFALRWA